ncbi:substrate-binding domain-containing protein [Planctomycetota bacterium]|nr:substrate-binding domain-containing protein [Planctomycetota bacterium]
MGKITRSQRVDEVYHSLKHKIDSGFFTPGSRYMSARDLSQRYELSYQTADRLLNDLEHEGRLVRRPQSGTYVAGNLPKFNHVQLFLPSRAVIKDSFSYTLHEHLEPALNRINSFDYSINIAESNKHVSIKATGRSVDMVMRSNVMQDHQLKEDALPMIWMRPRILVRCMAVGRRAILINEPPNVLHADLFDSVGVDNTAGGVIAGDALQRLLGRRARLGVISGPINDLRSIERVKGFKIRAQDAVVLHAGGWEASHGMRVAAQVARAKVDGLFCVNDRLADGVLNWLRKHKKPVPAVVGFDNAPVASELDLSTVAIPWAEFAEELRLMAERRLNEPEAPSRRVELVPKFIVRKFAQK